MIVLVTGAAGFIGYHVSEALLARGDTVIGVDNLNDYYDVSLKGARIERLRAHGGFIFHKVDISDREAMLRLAQDHPDVTHVLHLAAQPGVRYSLVNPYAYVAANVMGQLVVLEAARAFKRLTNVVYASSSSVYGGNEKVPFAESDAVDTPQSLYAATKRSDELIAHTYASLYGMSLVGLRFFTVYGPFGRPDMAPMIFARAILADEEIRVFNRGEMWRDFTYIDDIVSGVVASVDKRPVTDPPHRLYNLGNNRSEKLTDFIAMLERALGKKAKLRLEPMQPGDVVKTYADIERARDELGFEPTTPMSVGIPKFVKWYREFYKV
ncbi:MAG TPA: NAD-dependent epimerase/dehydratase family protein [Pseudolabrys sp.]|jgi:UDP-glucuronate 4-epimerase|nr:NAD-dependent epimerase/dehydratase family protein [Pseudolabrys sp.]